MHNYYTMQYIVPYFFSFFICAYLKRVVQFDKLGELVRLS